MKACPVTSPAKPTNRRQLGGKYAPSSRVCWGFSLPSLLYHSMGRETDLSALCSGHRAELGQFWEMRQNRIPEHKGSKT